MGKYFFVIALAILVSCKEKRNTNRNPETSVKQYDWAGDKKSIEVLDEVFNFLGGRNRWAEISSLYVYYTQSDGNFGSYSSIQWQSMDSLKIILDQYIKDKRFVRVLNDTVAWVFNEGEVSRMNEMNKEFLKYWYELDYYHIIHQLAIGEDIRVQFTNQNELFVSKNGTYFCAFKLDKEFRPTVFHRPNFNSQDISLEFLEWKEKENFKYPSKGQALSEDFSFQVEEIEFSTLSPEEEFQVSFSKEHFKLMYN